MTLAVAAGCVRPSHPEALDTPTAAPDSFVDYRAGTTGCIFGDCVSGPYAKRVDDRVISGVVGKALGRIDWERGPCNGWSYTGAILDDQPNGAGVLVPAEKRPYSRISSAFRAGEMMGEADVDVMLEDGGATHLRAPLKLDHSRCSIGFLDPTNVTLDSIDLVDALAPTWSAKFRGVVRIEDGFIVPWRGTIADDPVTRYILPGDGGWTLGRPAVCLAGDCISGSSTEHVGSGDFELYEGDFANGARDGRSSVKSVRGSGVDTFTVDYASGEAKQASLVRHGYSLTCNVDGEIRLSGPCKLDPGLPGAQVTVLFDDSGLGTFDRQGLPRLQAIAGMPESTPESLAVAALLEREIRRRSGTVVMERMSDASYRDADVGMIATTVAIADGARVVSISDVTYDRRQFKVDAPVRITAVESTWTWVPSRRLLVTGPMTFTMDGEELRHIHGDGRALASDGKRFPVVYYDGVRVDPLGFRSVAEYERASAKTRLARAKKLAKTAATTRAKDDRIILALRRVRTSITMAMDLLSNATSAIRGTATDALGWERVIRSAHVGVEQADDAIIDAARGADEATQRLAATDPCVDALATVTADIDDLDERLRVLMSAFDAFQYTDDAPRLQQIAQAFDADINALPTKDIVGHLATLQTFVDGALPPTPATLPKPKKAKAGAKPASDADTDTDTRTPSPPP